MKHQYWDGDTFEREGLTFRVNIEPDTDHGAPWDECDGHGPVSDWTSRNKAPGEILLHSDRRRKRFYDWQAATRIAKRDGWDLTDDDKATLAASLGRCPSTLTRGQIVAETVRRDFDCLRRWCEDQWQYVGVCVTLLDDEDDDNPPTDYGHALWGIESDEAGYIAETAHELADDIMAELQDAANAETATRLLECPG